MKSQGADEADDGKLVEARESVSIRTLTIRVRVVPAVCGYHAATEGENWEVKLEFRHVRPLRKIIH